MGLERGRQLGPYEIVEPIGAGGMGEVYRGRDKRLNRDIAIKVLPAQTADRTEARQRFEREAQAIAALNHPHICILHDIGCDAGTDYLVMELLEGETLAERLARGPLPIEDALKYATQIVDALDKAHRHGVVHRDLKPGNIMLTKSGVKLLDFGLAKLKQTADPSAAAGATREAMATLLTRNANLTIQGSIVGTLQYMSPEQLEAKESDARSDIFALGTILYEMVTGKRAFEARSQAGLVAAILEHDPAPMSSVQPQAPHLLDHVIKKCLAKSPDQRWQNAADILLALELIGLSPADSNGRRRRARWEIPVLAIAGAAVLVAILVAARLPRPAPATSDVSTMRFEIEMPQAPLGSRLSISPDGKRLAAIETGERGNRIWVRSLDELTGQILQGTEGASSPFWSPDSRFIGFFANGKLKTVDLSGAPPVPLCDTPALQDNGGTWNSDGVILFGSESGLLRVAATGGSPVPVTTLDKTRNETAHLVPHFLPDGKHFLFVAQSAKAESTAVFVDDLESRSRKLVVNSQFQALFAPPDYVLFIREATLLAQHFDLNRLELVGDPVPVAPLIILGTNGYAGFSVSSTGHLAYRAGSDVTLGREVGFVDRDGKPLAVPFKAGPGNYQNPVLSPTDERTVAVNRGEQGSDIWTFDQSGGSRKLTSDPAVDDHPLWSLDGKTIVFSSNRGTGKNDLYEISTSGTSQERPLYKSDNPKTPTDWSRDGRYIMYEDLDPISRSDLMILPRTGDGKPIEFVRTVANERQGRFSPDGKWVTYVSDESGRPEVYVQSFPATGKAWGPISSAGGFQPRWRADGKELFFISMSADDQFMAVDVLSKPTDTEFKTGAPKKLFILNVLTGGTPGSQRNSYDVTQDGQRFLLNGGVGTSPAPPLQPKVTLVLNWAAGLKK